MEISQLDTTNVFLGILASLAVVQMLAGIIAVIWLRRTVSRLSQTAATQLRPFVEESQQLARQTKEVISELRPLITRANTIVKGFEARTEHALMAVEAVNEHVDAAVHSGLNRLRAIEHGLRRGVETLVSFSNHR